MLEMKIMKDPLQKEMMRMTNLHNIKLSAVDILQQHKV